MPQDLSYEGITLLTSVGVLVIIIVGLEIFGILRKK
jgi:hypothetical protein